MLRHFLLWAKEKNKKKIIEKKGFKEVVFPTPNAILHKQFWEWVAEMWITSCLLPNTDSILYHYVRFMIAVTENKHPKNRQAVKLNKKQNFHIR